MEKHLIALLLSTGRRTRGRRKETAEAGEKDAKTIPLAVCRVRTICFVYTCGGCFVMITLFYNGFSCFRGIIVVLPAFIF